MNEYTLYWVDKFGALRMSQELNLALLLGCVDQELHINKQEVMEFDRSGEKTYRLSSKAILVRNT